jgi:hypothetical protein
VLFCFQGGKDKEFVKWLNDWLGKIDEKVKEVGSGKKRTVAVTVFSRSFQSQFSVVVFSRSFQSQFSVDGLPCEMMLRIKISDFISRGGP